MVAEFDGGVVGGEVPLDLALIGIGLPLPGSEFGVEGPEVLDAPVQALAVSTESSIGQPRHRTAPPSPPSHAATAGRPNTTSGPPNPWATDGSG